jgi:hypothetical protein
MPARLGEGEEVVVHPLLHLGKKEERVAILVPTLVRDMSSNLKRRLTTLEYAFNHTAKVCGTFSALCR